MIQKKIFFASDFHLGIPDYRSSLEREKAICRWLDQIRPEAMELYLLGDIFDFWFEHRYTCPKGYTRLLGKLAEMSDDGIAIHVFTGNHDMWMFDYLEREMNAVIHRKPVVIEKYGKKLMVGHGDGLGKGDPGYKIIKKIFANKLCQWMFARLHPNFSFALAMYLSRRSRLAQGWEEKFAGEEKEWLIGYCKDVLQKQPVDYFIFGHRHLVLDITLNGRSRYINLGHWLGNTGHFAVLPPDGSLEVCSFPVKHS